MRKPRWTQSLGLLFVGLVWGSTSACDRTSDALEHSVVVEGGGTPTAGSAFRASAQVDSKVPITTTSAKALEAFLEGRRLAERLRATDARQHFERAARLDPHFALAHLALANTAPSAQEFFASLERAKANLDSVSPAERHIILGVAAGVDSDPEGQLEHYRQLVLAHPEDERAQHLLATLYFGRQDYDAAIDHFERAIRANPRFSPPYNLLGYTFRALERYEAAEATFRQYIQLLPDEPNPYDSYAELMMKMGRFEESIASYRQALERDPNFVASFVGIGNNYLFMGRFDAARTAFERLAEVARSDGERRQALLWAMVSYLHDVDYEGALIMAHQRADLAVASDDLPSLAADLILIGDLELARGDLDAAETSYRRSLGVSERADVSAEVRQAARRNHHYDLARLALAAGDLATAEEHIVTYRSGALEHQIPFEIWRTHELAGRLALAHGDPVAARDELAQANQLDPWVLFLQAEANRDQGDLVRAHRLAEKVVDFNALNVNYAYVKPLAEALLNEI